MSKIIYCKICVNSSLRPRLTFDKNGVCDACNHNKIKNEIDWKQREKELKKLLNKYRSKDGSYDVIVPSSGGKDSCYVAYELKYVYGMHPLCVTYAPAMFTDIGWRNLKNFCENFDTLIYYPNRKIHSKLTRIAMEYFGDPFQPWHYGQQSYPLRVAINYKIPLVFYGENQDVEYGGDQSNANRGDETLKKREENQSLRVKKGVDTLIDIGIKKKILDSKLKKKNKIFEDYRLPKETDIKKNNIKMYFYSYFKKWILQDNYYYAQEKCNFKPDPERSLGTYSKYTSLDDKLDELYYYMQFIKFGFGRCTSEACIDIRDGFLTREEGVNLVKLFDGEFPEKYADECCKYMGISRKKLDKIIDKFRSKKVWKKEHGKWLVRNTIK